MLRKRLVYKIVGLSILLFLFIQAVRRAMRSSNEIAKFDFKTQKIIERSLRSSFNQDICQHPDLPVDSPAIMKFYQPSKPIDCGNNTQDWIKCEKSLCSVKPEIIAEYGTITCTYTEIIRKNDFHFSFGKKQTTTTKPFLLHNFDFCKVNCRSQYGWFGRKTWIGYVHGMRAVVKRRYKRKMTSKPAFNVLMFGFDSMSRNAFIRKLPKTHKFLLDELKTIVLNGYNIVGAGKSKALIPLLTGHTEFELPDTRENIPHAVSADAYPLIWNDFAKQGYVTSFNEDLPKYGTFQCSMKGFNKQPVHHYLRTFYNAIDRVWNYSRHKFCIGYTPAHMIMLDYTRNFMNNYRNTSSFIFSFLGELSYKYINPIGAIDDDFLQWLQQLRKESLLDNTILIIMSDHGNRFSEIRNTFQGRLEERLPFFSFTFPEKFKKRFRREFQNFQENSNRLSTPFDIHATLKNILALQQNQGSIGKMSKLFKSYIEHLSMQAPNRAISLFQNIPKGRSCADAFIETHWCGCLQYTQLSLNDSINSMIADKAAYAIIQTINDFTQNYRKLCAKLQLKTINWLLKSMPNMDNLAKTKKIKKSTEHNLRTSIKLYQIQIVTYPGNALFEATIQFDTITSIVNTKISQISRINNYGAQSACISFVNLDLTQYCYCIV